MLEMCEGATHVGHTYLMDILNESDGYFGRKGTQMGILVS